MPENPESLRKTRGPKVEPVLACLWPILGLSWAVLGQPVAVLGLFWPVLSCLGAVLAFVALLKGLKS